MRSLLSLSGFTQGDGTSLWGRAEVGSSKGTYDHGFPLAGPAVSVLESSPVDNPMLPSKPGQRVA